MAPATLLTPLFLAHLPEPARATVDLEQPLSAVWNAARQAWPSVELPVAAFLRHLAQRLPPGEDVVAAVQAVSAGDLYLACGCTIGDQRALAAFERAFMGQVVEYVARRDVLPDFGQELKQTLCERLLVAKTGLIPRIAGYTGRGSLAGWLRTTTARVAVDLRKAMSHKETSLEDVAQAVSVGPDPEISYLKNHYEQEFKAAVDETLAALPPREKNVLALYFLKQLDTDAIGKMYQVSDRTVRRWIESSRASILEKTMELLESRLQLSRTTLGNLIGLVQSQIDVSVGGLLGLSSGRRDE
jgi:RNA polymerase sigma-70 factor, ECF subfamily